jgi:hypothetical protein
MVLDFVRLILEDECYPRLRSENMIHELMRETNDNISYVLQLKSIYMLIIQ